MGYKNLIDMHVHTANSFDAEHSAMRMCEAAVKKSIRSITFTDHCEMDAIEKNDFSTAMTHAFVEVAKAKSAFIGTLLVNNGIEVGQPSYDREFADKIISRYDYDQVIGSVHNLRDRKDFYYIKNYASIDVKSLLDEYFDEIYSMIQWGNFDTLAHLDYPLRYISGEQNVPVDMSDFSEKTDEILKLLIKKDIALEINTSGLRQKIGRTLPDENILKRYKQLGGQMITVGSDAHCEEHVAMGIEQGFDLAKRCGFDSITLFQKRTPIQIPIE